MREKITPVRVADIVPSATLRPLITPNVFGVGEEKARQVLLHAVSGPSRPATPPVFPEAGVSGPRLPGPLPRVWNLPSRNASFTGRDTLLVQLRQKASAFRSEF